MKKLIAVMLSIVMIACLAVPAFAAKKTAKNYVLLGDSIAVGEGIANPREANYGRMVANTNGYNYANYAISGSMSSDMLRRLDSPDVAAAVKKADIISISIGGNDFLRNNLFFLLITIMAGNMSMVNDIVDSFYEQFCKIIERIKKLNPKALILMQTLYNPWRLQGIAGIYQKGVDALNASYRRYLKEHPGAYEIVDVGAAFAASGDDLIAIDTIHPNAKGNILIAKTILKKLNALGYEGKTEPVIKHEPLDKVSSNPMDYYKMALYYIGLVAL